MIKSTPLLLIYSFSAFCVVALCLSTPSQAQRKPRSEWLEQSGHFLLSPSDASLGKISLVLGKANDVSGSFSIEGHTAGLVSGTPIGPRGRNIILYLRGLDPRCPGQFEAKIDRSKHTAAYSGTDCRGDYSGTATMTPVNAEFSISSFQVVEDEMPHYSSKVTVYVVAQQPFRDQISTGLSRDPRVDLAENPLNADLVFYYRTGYAQSSGSGFGSVVVPSVAQETGEGEALMLSQDGNARLLWSYFQQRDWGFEKRPAIKVVNEFLSALFN